VGDSPVRIVLVAEEAAGVHALRLVTGSVHELHAVLTSSSAGGSSRGVTVASAARKGAVPILPAELVKDPAFADVLMREGVDVLLNVHSLHLVNPAVLSAPQFGCFNLHPGPLPAYAGRNVPSWALYQGEKTHGVTLHWMTPRVDAGAIAYSASFDLSPRDTGLSVSASCARLGLTLIARLLGDLASDPPAIPALEQDQQAWRYFGREVPHDGWIPWACPSQQVVDFVRACDYGPFASPWGKPRTRSRRGVVTVGRAGRTGQRTDGLPPGTVGSCDDLEATVAAGDEWVVLGDLRAGAEAVRPVDALAQGEMLLARTGPLG
jgi:methionyl-tRNA formyltransferase